MQCILNILKFWLLNDLELVSSPSIPPPWPGLPIVQQPGRRGSTEPALRCPLAPTSSGETPPGDLTAWAEGCWDCSPWSWTNSQPCESTKPVRCQNPVPLFPPSRWLPPWASKQDDTHGRMCDGDGPQGGRSIHSFIHSTNIYTEVTLNFQLMFTNPTTHLAKYEEE